jgi:AcrR family transcriptional regulator
MSRTGRPRALSRATLEEAANELFLEQSYLLASIDDIAARAGVSRATFFNYFGQKSDLLFVTVDEALDTLEKHVATGATLREALHQTAQAFTRSRVPLVATQAEAMGALEDALLAGPLRLVRLRTIVGMLVTEPVWQWAIAGAIAEGAIVWATSAPGHLDLADTLDAHLLELTTLPTHVKSVLVP